MNLVYYGSGNPSTWNPKQRPGDNKWSMTIWARNPDTGVAKWVYQMTPHDEWDYDGVNEMILTDQSIDGKPRKLLTHFDRNGLGYTLDRADGELLVAQKYDPKVNWTSGVDMNKNSPTYGRPKVLDEYSTDKQGEDHNNKGICPAALGSKDEQPAAYSPDTQLFYVPTNHVCMDYEPFKVSYTAGQPYVGATLSMYPPPGETHMGNFIAWDGKTGKIVWSNKEQFSVWSGALATAGGVVFYGTLEGYLKAVDAKTGKELYKFKTPSGIIGNVTTYEHGGRQYIAVLSGVGGWAGIGLAAGLTDPTAGLGAVGGYAALTNYTALGGALTVFALPSSELTTSFRRVDSSHAPGDVASTVEDKLLRIICLVAAAAILVAAGGIAFADGSGDPAAVKSEDGKYLDKEGNPTYKIQADGTVDWYTYSGYRRYHSECHVCHGPDGMGSSYAPALKDSLKTMSYGDFLAIVASGRKNVTTSQDNVMPAFGDNPNVACYMDDLYVYLRARANDAHGARAPGEARGEIQGLYRCGKILHGALRHRTSASRVSETGLRR